MADLTAPDPTTPIQKIDGGTTLGGIAVTGVRTPLPVNDPPAPISISDSTNLTTGSFQVASNANVG